MQDVSVSLTWVPHVAQYPQKIDAKNMALAPASASPTDSKPWGHDERIFQRGASYFKWFVSEKKSGFQKLL